MYVSKASKHIAPLDLFFFDTAEGNAPKINISAIVGKNGEGKLSKPKYYPNLTFYYIEYQ